MSNVNMDALLEGTLDQLADIPAFIPYPAGVHRVQLFLEPKMVNDKLAVSANFKYVSLVELVDPGTPEAPTKVPEAGDKANVLCQMDNEFGQGTFKMIRSAIQGAVNLDNNASHKAVIDATQGMEVQIVTSLRADKTDADKKYLQLKAIAVV